VEVRVFASGGTCVRMWRYVCSHVEVRVFACATCASYVPPRREAHRIPIVDSLTVRVNRCLESCDLMSVVYVELFGFVSIQSRDSSPRAPRVECVKTHMK